MFRTEFQLQGATRRHLGSATVTGQDGILRVSGEMPVTRDDQAGVTCDSVLALAATAHPDPTCRSG
ncbi:MAG: hypothetical protein V3T48_06585 [Vicinamibacterales bacterium]|jgi:hypothetical protein